jgi:hypothetical protein
VSPFFLLRTWLALEKGLKSLWVPHLDQSAKALATAEGAATFKRSHIDPVNTETYFIDITN